MLRIEGGLDGAVYFDGGRITFGESSGAPGIGVRLACSRRLSEHQWRMLTAERPPSKAGDLLIEQGLITRDELRAVLRSAALDAIIALTVPTTDPALRVSTRFVPRQRHWAGSMIRLDFETVRGEIARSASRPAQHRIRPGARPELSDVRRSSVIVDRDQWRVACHIDGRTSVWDLAWRNGFALSDTAERVGELVAAGLCTLADTGEPRTSQPPAPGPPLSLPRRRRGATLPGRPPATAVIPDPLPGLGDEVTLPAPAHPELLRRLLDGLRQME